MLGRCVLASQSNLEGYRVHGNTFRRLPRKERPCLPRQRSALRRLHKRENQQSPYEPILRDVFQQRKACLPPCQNFLVQIHLEPNRTYAGELPAVIFDHRTENIRAKKGHTLRFLDRESIVLITPEHSEYALRGAFQ